MVVGRLMGIGYFSGVGGGVRTVSDADWAVVDTIRAVNGVD